MDVEFVFSNFVEEFAFGTCFHSLLTFWLFHLDFGLGLCPLSFLLGVKSLKGMKLKQSLILKMLWALTTQMLLACMWRYCCLHYMHAFERMSMLMVVCEVNLRNVSLHCYFVYWLVAWEADFQAKA